MSEEVKGRRGEGKGDGRTHLDLVHSRRDVELLGEQFLEVFDAADIRETNVA